MKPQAYFVLFLLFLISCNGKKRNEANSLPTENDINEVVKVIVFHKGFHFVSENSITPISIELKNRIIIDKRKKAKEYEESPFHRKDTLAMSDLIGNTNFPVKDFFKKEDWEFIKLQNKKVIQKLSPKMFGNLKFTTVNKKHEDWYYYFSVPIFSSDLKKAYLQYSGIYEDYCNDGTEIFLEKKNDKWEIVGNSFWSH
ncbi:hypothetical protein WFZ85_15650 [Flavobacterium sp. j3]|uniref:Lipoprotein n=1 Tax=Flavobacterium aureirubrum TaxID=3133147 RepID=A0ABU9N8L2_9FLAO